MICVTAVITMTVRGSLLTVKRLAPTLILRVLVVLESLLMIRLKMRSVLIAVATMTLSGAPKKSVKESLLFRAVRTMMMMTM